MPQTRCGARDTSSARAHPRMHVTTACRPPRGIGLAIGRYMARPSSVQWVPQRKKKTAIQRGDAEDWRLAADGRRIAGHKCIAPAGLCCAAARLEQAASHREQLVGRTGEGDYEVAPRPICGASSNVDVHTDELHCSSQARSVPSNDFEEVASLMREWIELDQSPFPFASSAAVAWSWP